MIEHYFLMFWAAWLLLLLLAALRVIGFGAARRWQDRKWRDRTRNQQGAAVIIPVKGFDLQSTPRFFDTLFDQDYKNYRVIVTFESWNDPVAEWLLEHLDLSKSDPTWNHPDPDDGLKSIILVSAGVAHNEGQKVHNQIAAFRELTTEDKVIAFADADIVFEKDWLAQLLAPINLGTHRLATTYRWLVPKRPTLANQFACVINGSIATQGGTELLTVLWGGSMALSREVFDDIDVPNLLIGSLNDDLRISKAARKAGNKIAFIRSLILPTPIDFTWRSFFEFAKRQYTQVKFFSPILYTGVNIMLGFYALGALSLIAALAYGYFYAWVPIAAAYVIDQIRGLARQQVYLSLYHEAEIRRKLFSACWLEHMLTPVWMLMHQLLIFSTWTQKRITWAGIQYQILGKDKTKILHRPASTDKLPIGAPGLALIAELHDRKRGTYTQPIETSVPEESQSTKDKAKTPKTASIAPVSEPAQPLRSPSPTSVGPFSHPGHSSVVTALATAPRFSDLHTPSRSSNHFSAASRINPLLFQVSIPRSAVVNLTRYQPLSEPSPAWIEELSNEPRRSSSVQLIFESIEIVKTPIPMAEAMPTRQEASPKRTRPLTPSKVQQRLNKTRIKQQKLFKTSPNLATSSAPVFNPPTMEAVPPSTPVLPAKEEKSLTPLPFVAGRSHAAQRANCSRRDRRVGPVGKRTSRSSRTAQASAASRGSMRNRPVTRKASGRPV